MQLPNREGGHSGSTSRPPSAQVRVSSSGFVKEKFNIPASTGRFVSIMRH